MSRESTTVRTNNLAEVSCVAYIFNKLIFNRPLLKYKLKYHTCKKGVT